MYMYMHIHKDTHTYKCIHIYIYICLSAHYSGSTALKNTKDKKFEVKKEKKEREAQ